MSDSNKDYVSRQIDIANTTSGEAMRDEAIYRAGTQMEVIPCTGNVKLSEADQHLVLDAADKLLRGK